MHLRKGESAGGSTSCVELVITLALAERKGKGGGAILTGEPEDESHQHGLSLTHPVLNLEMVCDMTRAPTISHHMIHLLT